MPQKVKNSMKFTNEYRINFHVRCPGNNKKVKYKLKIRTSSTIMVEDICDAVQNFKATYHETIADELVARFGGHQKLTAHHHGVDIKTFRSSNET